MIRNAHEKKPHKRYIYIYIYVIHAYSCNSRRTCRLTETNDYTWSLFSGFHNTSKSILTAKLPKSQAFWANFIPLFCLSICCLKKDLLECIFYFHCWSFIVRSTFQKFFDLILFLFFWRIESRVIFFFFFCHTFELLRNFIQGRYWSILNNCTRSLIRFLVDCYTKI